MMKRHVVFLLFFTVLIFVFLGKLILMKSAFLYGDYLVQFYPWSSLYAESIKQFRFPFWVPYFHCGFPLMAEGQIGGFYPLNILMFFFLPFKVAYNYSVVLHFVLAGLFTYAYARAIGTDQWGGSVATLLFCFASAYAGCFYNTVTVKTLIWFPLALLLMERYFDSKRLLYVIGFGLLLGMQLLAGFTQLALYSAIFYSIYFFYGLRVHRNLKISDAYRFIIALGIAAVLFYPQFILSWQLVRVSSRSTASLLFALWGSFSPFNALSVCFPYWIFYGSRFYISIAGMLFFFVSLYYLKRQPKIRPLFAVFIVAFLLALGAYNPVYVVLLRLTHFYGFRNPSKFLFFSVFAASVLSGLGFSKFFMKTELSVRKRALRTNVIFLSSMLALFFMVKALLFLCKSQILALGKWYVITFIFSKAHHRRSLDSYLEGVRSFYDVLVTNSSSSNIFILASLVLCIGLLLVSIFMARKSKNLNPSARILFLGVMCIDLYIFSLYGTGFRGNIEPFDNLRVSHQKILGILQHDRELFRILPFGLLEKKMPFWAKPNTNCLYRIDSVAAYAPLATQRYKERLLPLEVVDDSLGVLTPDLDSVEKNQDLLRLLNVKYIVTPLKLDFDSLVQVFEEDGVFLYRLKDYLPRIFFTRQLAPRMHKEAMVVVKIMQYKSDMIEAEVEAPDNGFLVFSEQQYPGWSVLVDGVRREIIPVNGIIQAVELPSGKHQVLFRYRPIFSFKQ